MPGKIKGRLLVPMSRKELVEVSRAPSKVAEGATLRAGDVLHSMWGNAWYRSTVATHDYADEKKILLLFHHSLVENAVTRFVRADGKRILVGCYPSRGATIVEVKDPSGRDKKEVAPWGVLTVRWSERDH